MKELIIAEYFPLIKESQITSDEELYFIWWLIDLKKAGYVENVVFEPTSFELSETVSKKYIKKKQLKTKLKVEENVEILISGSVYTPDFLIFWTEKAEGIFCDTMESEKQLVYNRSVKTNIGVKRGLSIFSYSEVKADFDNKNMTRLAKTNIKWTYQKHNVFVNINKIPSLFKDTFTPSRYLYNKKNGKLRKINFKTRSLEQYIASLQK